jgi:integrase/recombinase XerC
MTSKHHSMRTTPHAPTAHHGDLIDHYLAHLARIRRSPRTVATYGDALWPAHRDLPAGLPQALPAELERWLANPAWSATTQRLRTTILRRFFGWAVERGHLSYDPAERLISPDLPWRAPRAATDEQVAAILSRTTGPVRLWAVLASRAGLRAIEIARLCRQDITQHTVTVIGKGDKQRSVPTHPAVWRAIADLPPGPIVERLPGDTDDRVAHRISAASWRVYARAGVRTSIHRLRAWCGTTLLQAGHDLSVVQDYLGHASPVTTRRYATPSEAQMRQAMLSLPDTDAAAAADRPGPPRPRPPSAAPAPGPDGCGSPPPARTPDPHTAPRPRQATTT